MLGALRIAWLNVAHTARTSASATHRPMAARANLGDEDAQISGPIGEMTIANVVQADSARPSSRSGIIAIRYPWTTESVDGMTSAVGKRHTAST